MAMPTAVVVAMDMAMVVARSGAHGHGGGHGQGQGGGHGHFEGERGLNPRVSLGSRSISSLIIAVRDSHSNRLSNRRSLILVV